jgi:uncharacterized protein YjbI with pentapeptide repeats
MANEEHLAILKQGVKAWNKWRDENPRIRPDLGDETFDHATLISADNIRAHVNYAGHRDVYHADGNFIRAQFNHADLSFANFSDANLRGADFREANLRRADLRHADLSFAELIGADLRDANLGYASLRGADLGNANLIDAHLGSVDMTGAKLTGADLTLAYVEFATLGDIDLSAVNGLERVRHYHPSTIGISTLYKSAGNIPERFLRGCGLSDWEIEAAKLYNPDLSNEEINDIQYKIHDLRVNRAFQINPLFISYSHTDSPFVDRIEKLFDQKGIRYWRDIQHATAGRLEKQIDHAINLNDIVLLVLSEHSTNSDWVQYEARKAREKERKMGNDALCPVALDGSWKTCRWPERLREQIMEYNILDFSGWQDDKQLQSMFSKLINGLSIFYK